MGLAARVTLRNKFWFIWESERDDLGTIEELQEALDAGESLPGTRLVLEKCTYDPSILGLHVDPRDHRRVRLVAREIPYELWPEVVAEITEPYYRIARLEPLDS